MLSGDNGILQRATEAKTRTERQSIVEQAKTDILGYQVENKGGDLEKLQLKSVLDTYFKDVPTELPDGEELSNLQLVTLDKYGTHQIKVSEIYNGSLISENTTYSNDVRTKLALNLNAESNDNKSPWVQYNGEKYKVLYNDANGIEIIKMENLDSYTKGYNDEYLPATVPNGYDFNNADSDIANFEKARWSYNNLIENLNKKATSLYPSNSIIDDARCVGSRPGKTNKNTKNSTLISSPSYVSGKGLEQGENVYDTDNATMVVDQPNYTSDFQRMTDLGILLEDTYYILASRSVGYVSASTNFGFSYMEEGYLSAADICFVNSDGSLGAYDEEDYFRPVLLLKSSVQIASGNGPENSPFVLM